mgnify:CR=1 FL=1
MSEETQNVDAGTDETQYLDGLGGSNDPIQVSEGEQQAPEPVDELEAFDENLMPPEFVQDEPASPDGNIEPKGDQGRYEYWQSKYDTLERDYNQKTDELKKILKSLKLLLVIFLVILNRFPLKANLLTYQRSQSVQLNLLTMIHLKPIWM